MRTLRNYLPPQPKKPGKLPYVPQRWIMMLTVCALSLSGCATNSPQPAVICPPLPAIPPALTPQPQPTYSEQWRQKVEGWRSSLTATPLIQPGAATD